MAENEASSSAETDETSFERSVYTEFFEVLEKMVKILQFYAKCAHRLRRRRSELLSIALQV